MELKEALENIINEYHRCNNNFLLVEKSDGLYFTLTELEQAGLVQYTNGKWSVVE